MSTDVEPVPDSFLAKLLDEFGLQWTHLVILSGVVFTSFQLDEYLNSGVWVLGTVGAFAVAYIFRHQVSGNFPRTVFWCLVSLTTALAGPMLILRTSNLDVPQYIKRNSDAVSLYLAVSSGIPIGFAILSYRRQEDELFTPLPRELARAVKTSVTRASIIQRSVHYIISLSPVEDSQGRGVLFDYEVTMNVTNRSKSTVNYSDIFDPAGRHRYFRYASLNGDAVNVKAPDRLTERALVLTHKLAPEESLEVIVAGGSTFHGRDSELVGCYIPTGRLSIVLRRPVDEIDVNFQSLLPTHIDPAELTNGDLRFEYNDGLLPFQGARVFWHRRDTPATSP